jgi:DNA repair exonuclease SbcCD nuclease subunit
MIHKETMLLVGDPHLQLSRIEDAAFFVDSVIKVVEQSKPKYTVVLGDLFDTFGVIRTEVLSQWNRFVDGVKDHTKLILMVGNHDQAGAEGGAHALETFSSRATVVDKLTSIDGMYFMPFVRDNAEFETACRSIPEGSLLFSHGEWQLSQYENGFFSPHGASMDSIKHLSQVISGHIHLAQQHDNLWHPGTPFQKTFADAGQEKFIYYGYVENNRFVTSQALKLNLPEFVIVEAETTAELLEKLPVPVAQNRYKFIAKGTGQEIEAFWKDDKVKAFRSSVYKVVDALASIRIGNLLPKVEGVTLEERISNWAKTRDWKVNSERLIEAAGKYLA